MALVGCGKIARRPITTGGQTRAAAFGLEMADFARAVREGAPLEAGPEQSVSDLRVVLAMYREAESGRWEAV
jgi:predicted dehydrogenase